MTLGPKYIAVIGSGQCGDDICKTAYRVGKAIAESGAILICGGLGGVMDAAAEGAKSAGGMTVGILPDHNRIGASKFLDVAIPSGIGEMRNALVVRSADALVAVSGEYGTLAEIGFALKTGKPVVGLDTWQLATSAGKNTEIIVADDPEKAVELAIEAIG